MGNLVHAELHKALQHRRIMGTLLALCILCPVLVVFNFWWAVRHGTSAWDSEVMDTALFALCQGMGVGPFLALPVASVVFDDQYRHGTLKNEAVFGIRRWESYLSRVLAGAVLGLGLAVIAVVSFVGPAALLLPGRVYLPELMWKYGPTLLAAIPMWLCSGVIALSLLFFFRNSGLASVLYVLFFTVGFVGMGLMSVLMDYYEGIIARVIGVICTLHPFNVLWANMYQADAFGTSLSWNLIFGSPAWNWLGISWLTALGWSVLSAGLALLALYHREFR